MLVSENKRVMEILVGAVFLRLLLLQLQHKLGHLRVWRGWQHVIDCLFVLSELEKLLRLENS